MEGRGIWWMAFGWMDGMRMDGLDEDGWMDGLSKLIGLSGE